VKHITDNTLRRFLLQEICQHGLGRERLDYRKDLAGKEAWESLWGPIDKPLSKTDYPQNWKVWENEVLFPFLDQDPDKIKFTSCQEL
jgi:hypothetical protein